MPWGAKAAFDASSSGHRTSVVLLALHKPWGVLSQFTRDGSAHRTLSEFGMPPRVYPVGRLDADSEGLLLLADDARWNARLLRSTPPHPRSYWVQVEGVPDAASLAKLAAGVSIQGHQTLPCRARFLDPRPVVAPRDPPIRFRKSVPDSWIELELVEGRNRQVRRMTAAIGHPTLRLIRVRIGAFELGDLAPGSWTRLSSAAERAVLEIPRG